VPEEVRVAARSPGSDGADRTPRPAPGQPGPDLEPAEPPTWADLYARTHVLTLKTQTGAADGVLSEIHAVLALARAAGADRVVHQLLYIEALCNFHLGHLEECIEGFNRLTAEVTDSPVDRGWLSSSASMRAVVHIVAGDRTAGIAELTEAAIHLRDSPPRGLAYIWAVNVLGVGYLALRMYELALTQYDHIAAQASVSQYKVSALYRVLNAQLGHIYWGLELDRLGSADASDHFEQALTLGEQARHLLSSTQDLQATWEMALAGRSGLCRAFLGDFKGAADQLVPVIEPLARHEVDDAIVARIGLIRAYSNMNAEAAVAQADRALLSITHTTDYALAMGAAWERVRLFVDQPGVEAELDYALRLAKMSWEERARVSSTMESRIAHETVRRQQARETERLLYDGGTGLASRVSFLQQLAARVTEAQQLGSAVGIGFLELPANEFDDTLERILPTLQVDLIARYDTHELAVVALGLDGEDLAARIRACGTEVLRHLTAGVASLIAPTSVTALMLHADEALLAARQRGGIVVNRHGLEELRSTG
jgi:GGDEF domain-containing protein